MDKRPPNRICPVCNRKMLAAEKSLGKWFFPHKKICYNCTSLESACFGYIRANKKVLIKSNEELRFPLLILDFERDKLIGQHNDVEKLKSRLVEYRKSNPLAVLKVIDTKYRDYTDNFANWL
jgi:hypothetical protein